METRAASSRLLYTIVFAYIRVRIRRPVKASGQAVAGDHAAALVSAGKIARADEACERRGVWKERADGANIGQLIT